MSESRPKRLWRCFVHGYPGVDSGIIWQTIVKDIRPLRMALRALLAAEPA